MSISRAIALSLALAVTALAPAAAIAKNGADDGPGDDNGGRFGDTSGGSGSGSGGGGGGSGGGGGDRAKLGTVRCTGNASAKIKAKHDDGRIEVEFDVDQNRNGVRWNVSIRRNGARVVSTTATTRAPSGSFSVERKIANRAGTDRITARARTSSGQVCTGSVSI